MREKKFQKIRLSSTGCWILITAFSLGGAAIGAFISHAYPSPGVESRVNIFLGASINEDQVVFGLRETMPKCQNGNANVNKAALVQAVLPVKASPNYINLKISGDSVADVESCLLETAKFIIDARNKDINNRIYFLDSEVFAIDQVLHRFSKGNKLGAAEDSYLSTYPQDLLLRKYKILREINEFRENSSRVSGAFSTYENSILSLLILRCVVGILIGFLLGLLIIAFVDRTDRFSSNSLT